MDDPERAERVAAGFSALANPLRVRILQALADTREPDWEHRGMSYSELRGTVDVEDGGRFNYHLDELRGEYVAVDDGHYWLTPTGSRVVDEIYAGTFGDSPDRREGSIDRDCQLCGEELSAVFEEGILRVECPDHGVVHDMSLSPRVATDRDLDALSAWSHRRALWYLESVSWNVCPRCGGTFGDAAFEPAAETEKAATVERDPRSERDVLVGHTCSRCGIAFRVPLLGYAATAAPTIAFFYDYGIDPRTADWTGTARPWTYGAVLQDDTVSAWFEVEDDRLELEIDRSLDVVDATRREGAETT